MSNLYNFKKIENYWQIFWIKNKIFKIDKNLKKKKYFILNMFPYPSGSGLHVGHPLGYIASDIYAKYKKFKGYNVLNPIGFDSFGLPTEQYAINTGQHPYITTKKNIKKYQKQLNKLGLSLNWERKFYTSDPNYYKWTQWIFIQLFHSWYDTKNKKARPIKDLISIFEKKGNIFSKKNFSSKEWKNFNFKKKEKILLNFRLAYLCKKEINWCPKLGTVLANDEIKNGISERGGYPILKKKMIQWHIRITVYSDRLLNGLKKINCSNSLKKSQINWIGKCKGINILFKINNIKIKIFTNHPDKIFGITFLIIKHNSILIKKNINFFYKKKIKNFTGEYAIHPFTKKKIPIYISNHFSCKYNKGITLGIPNKNKKHYKFAKKFNIKIINIINKKKKYINSFFLNGLNKKQAIKMSIKNITKKKMGNKKVNFNLKDAVFSRQRYWGEPIPIYFKKNIPITIPENKLPLLLPKVKKNFFLKSKKNHLKKIKYWAWNEKKKKIVSKKFINNKKIFPIEINTMPGWAGSSWYFLRYMDPNNKKFFIENNKEKYWKNIDLYIGGIEHATGHLIYARFYHKFFKDRGWISTEEPFKKILNQGMILGNSAFIARDKKNKNFISFTLIKNKKRIQELPIDIKIIKNHNEVIINKFKKKYNNKSKIILDKKKFFCKRKLEKMSKSKKNVINPDKICFKYGADTFRLYEMFIGPFKETKIWNTKNIIGIFNFLKKIWKLFHIKGYFYVEDTLPSKKELKIINFLIKKIKNDINNYSFNTSISFFMISINKLYKLKCIKRKILEPLIILLSLYAPHISEELWYLLGRKKSIYFYNLPNFKSKYLKKKNIKYPVTFNGKKRFQINFFYKKSIKEMKKIIKNYNKTKFFLRKKKIKKIIIIKNKIINIVF
jgi:leucyl-tRNA synthetase